MRRFLQAVFLVGFALGFCSHLFGFQTGNASWYGGKFQGRSTANGEIFDTNKFTAAHRTLPFGTFVKVTNLRNGKSTIVRINDRGPFIQGRIIDLSKAAAKAIDMLELGTAPVSIEVVEDEKAATADPESAGEPAIVDAGGASGGDPRTISPVATSALSERFIIQVGSFSMTRNALSMRRKLESHGFSAAFESGGKGIIRVILPNIEASALDTVQERLSEAGITDVLVRRN